MNVNQLRAKVNAVIKDARTQPSINFDRSRAEQVLGRFLVFLINNNQMEAAKLLSESFVTQLPKREKKA